MSFLSEKRPLLGCREMVERTSEEYMLRQLAEECTELAQAALKVIRAANRETPVHTRDARLALVEEVADVKVMLRIFDSAVLTAAEVKHVGEIQAAKMQRFSDRIRGKE